MRKDRIVGIVLLCILALIINQCSSAKRNDNGEISKAGDLDAYVTQVGDCLETFPAAAGTTELISTLDAIPCSQPHRWEVFYKSSSNLDTFTEQGVSDEANSLCNSAIEAILSSASSIKVNEYATARLGSINPTSNTWNLKNDRAIDCLIGSDTQFYYSSILE